MANLREIEANSKLLLKKLDEDEVKLCDYLKTTIQKILSNYLYHIKQNSAKQPPGLENLVTTAVTKLEQVPTYAISIENPTPESLEQMRKFLLNTHIAFMNGQRVENYVQTLKEALRCAVHIERSPTGFSPNEEQFLPLMLMHLFLFTPSQKALNILQRNVTILTNVSQSVSTLNLKNVAASNLADIRQQLEQILVQVKNIETVCTLTLNEIN